MLSKQIVQKSILILDDDVDSADLYRDVLERQGFSVFIFNKPKSALDCLKMNYDIFSLIITSFRMPEMNGIEFAMRVREIANNITIWLITAFAPQHLEDYKGFTYANFEKIVEKPISIIKLIDMVKSRLK